MKKFKYVITTRTDGRGHKIYYASRVRPWYLGGNVPIRYNHFVSNKSFLEWDDRQAMLTAIETDAYRMRMKPEVITYKTEVIEA